MGLFIDQPAATPRLRISILSTLSLVVTITGLLTVIGFFVGPVMAHVAIIRHGIARRRGEWLSGRWMAILALIIAYSAMFIAVITIAAILIIAYGALPAPDFF